MSYASDNDGSAFITKAEFDSLKNTFQSQLDEYNKGIDNKIDAAISAYLVGVRRNTNLQLSVIPSDWENVFFMNQVIKPTFRLPEFSCIYGFGAASWVAWNNLKEISVHGRNYFNFKWDATDGLNCYRPLFGLINGTEKTPGDIYWRGVARRYHEKMIQGFSCNDFYADLGWLDLYPGYCTIYLQNFFKFNYTGYLSDLSSTSLFSPTSKFRYYTGSAYVMTDKDSNKILNAKLETNVTLDDDSGTTIDYEHIIQYDKTSSWDLSNENFLNTFRVHGDNTYTDASLDSKVTKDISNQYVTMCSTTFKNGEVGGVTYTNSGDKLISIGMISAKTASEIYQFEEDKSFIVDKVNIPVRNVTLEKGLPVLGAVKNSQVEWTAEISEVYAYNGGSYVTDANEVDIYASYEPFSDKVISTDLIKFKDASGIERNYITTASKKATLKWTQKKDGVIYIKCVPHFTGTSYLDKDWRVKLNLSGISNTCKINLS